MLDETRGVVYFTGREKSPARAPPLPRRPGRLGPAAPVARSRASTRDLEPGPPLLPRRPLEPRDPPDPVPARCERRPKADAGTVRPISWRPFQVQYPEMLTIPADDGFPLPARIFKPKDFDPKRSYPVILNVYGEPNAPLVADEWDGFTFYNQVLLRQGYLVVSVDPRSATGGVEVARERGPQPRRRRRGAARPRGRSAVAQDAAVGRPDAGRDLGLERRAAPPTLLAMTRSTEWKAAIAVAPVTRPGLLRHEVRRDLHEDARRRTPRVTSTCRS